MSLEQKIEALTAAIEANTAAMKSTGGTAAGATGKTEKVEKTTKTTKTTTKKSEHSVEEAQAVLIKIKDEFGIDNAREVLKKHGVAKMAEIPADKADAVFADATAKYEELTGDGDVDGDVDGGL